MLLLMFVKSSFPHYNQGDSFRKVQLISPITSASISSRISCIWWHSGRRIYCEDI